MSADEFSMATIQAWPNVLEHKNVFDKIYEDHIDLCTLFNNLMVIKKYVSCESRLMIVDKLWGNGRWRGTYKMVNVIERPFQFHKL
jgi:hypothetical protein